MASETYKAVGFFLLLKRKKCSSNPTPTHIWSAIQQQSPVVCQHKTLKNGSRFSTFMFPFLKKKRVRGWQVLQPRTNSAQQEKQRINGGPDSGAHKAAHEQRRGEQRTTMMKLVLWFYKAGTDGPGRLRVSFSWNFSHISRATFPLFSGKGSLCRRPMVCQWFCSIPQPKPEKGI